jgi:glycosyltransferase involved in cell wall biosynthesis
MSESPRELLAMDHTISHFDSPLLSVVITSYTLDRLPDVLGAVESLSHQTYGNIEIIFVGEGPKELCERVEAFARERGVSRLHTVVNDGRPGLSFARNLGVRHAHGEIIAFVDDDAVPARDWTERIVQAFLSRPEVIGVTGQAIPLWMDEGTQWFPEEFDWIIGSTRFTGWKEVRPVRNAAGVNMAFRREAFHYCHFSEVLVGGNQGDPTGTKGGLVGDDTLFSLELYAETKRPILFDPRVRVYNKVYAHRLRSRFVRQRAFWEGYTKGTLVRLYSKDQMVKLSTEFSLLRRILFRFFPRALWQLTYDRPTAWRKLALAVFVLFHVGLGYLAASFPGPGKWLARGYSS